MVDTVLTNSDCLVARQPKNRKRWIDPKKSVKYEIVERSTDDVLSSTSGVAQNVLRVVKDQRPRRRRADDPMHVSQTEDGELVLEGEDQRPSSSRPSQSNSIFESDDEDSEMVEGSSKKQGGSMFSDDEDSYSDDGSSDVGSETHEEDDIDEDSKRYMRTVAPREPDWKPVAGKSKQPAFVRNGYDYGKHMKPTGVVPGAVFVNKDGSMTTVDSDDEEEPSNKKVGPQLLPAELFASKPSKNAVDAHEHDKRYGMVGDIDKDVLAMLDSDDEDYAGEKALADGNESEVDPDELLDDDFVLKAIQPAEGEDPNFDAKAYLDRIYRTGMLPGEESDPFGDDLEDIDDFLSNAPTKGHGKKGGKQGSLDDIDDDLSVPSHRKPKGKNVRFVDYGEEDDEEDGEYDEDIFADDDESHGRFGNIPGAAPLSAEEAARARHKYQVALAQFEEDEPDEIEVPYGLDVNELDDILDEVLDNAVTLGLRPATSKREMARRAKKMLEQDDEEDGEYSEEDGEFSEEDGEDSDEDDGEDGQAGRKHHKKQKARPRTDSQTSSASRVVMTSGPNPVPVWIPDSDNEEMEEAEQKQEAQWDVESYVSTYTNTENHPRLVDQSSLNRRIMLGREGVPVGVLQHERKRAARENRDRQRAEDEAYLASRERDQPRVNIGVARPKDETPEERKARKEAAKLDKRVTRETKRALKDSFRKETVRQQRQEAGQSRATIVHM